MNEKYTAKCYGCVDTAVRKKDICKHRLFPMHPVLTGYIKREENVSHGTAFTKLFNVNFRLSQSSALCDHRQVLVFYKQY
jgi:hypothetical protein